MAPERVGGRRGDHHSDIYSLGAILYELTTGHRPFEGDNVYVIMNARTSGDPVAPRKLIPALSPAIEEIILHAPARDPSDRYPTAGDMAAELADYGQVTLTGRHQHLVVPRTAPSEGWAMRGILIGAIVVIVQLLGFGLLFWYFSKVRGHH
jgi:serine/threonine protein kinase